MIFPSLSYETVLQVEDKTRLLAANSFSNGSETITDVLIRPEASESFISVFNSDKDKWFLDWAYITDGIKTITVRVTTDITPGGRDRDFSINIITPEDDTLFSGDSDLLSWEPKILNYLPKGKNSFLYAHRKAQDLIISYLDEQRIWNSDGTRVTKEQIAGQADDEIREQFKQWSIFQTLLIVFGSIQVSDDDIFEDKKERYESYMKSARNRSALRLDLNKDGEINSNPIDIRTLRMYRR